MVHENISGVIGMNIVGKITVKKPNNDYNVLLCLIMTCLIMPYTNSAHYLDSHG